MATVVSTPQVAYRTAILTGTAQASSQNLTFAISVAGWELHVPFAGVQPNTANISAGWEMYAYRSSDAGASYETIAAIGMSVTRNPNTRDVKNLVIPTGFWLLRIINGGNVAATWSFSIGTQDEITAIINV